MYWHYLKYLLRHKWYVFLECIKVGMIIHGIFHDMSKFLPSEFIPYARWFYDGKHNKEEFDIAWCYHQHRNKHHWDYWVKSDGEAVPMPFKYIAQMVIDWKAMGRVFGDTAVAFYTANKKRMNLHPKTIEYLEEILSYTHSD